MTKKLIGHVFVIKQKSTGFVLPAAGKKKGGRTRDSFKDPRRHAPRVFTRRHFAQAALDWWLDGIYYESYSTDGMGDLINFPKPERAANKDDYEIVQLSYKEV